MKGRRWLKITDKIFGYTLIRSTYVVTIYGKLRPKVGRVHCKHYKCERREISKYVWCLSNGQHEWPL